MPSSLFFSGSEGSLKRPGLSEEYKFCQSSNIVDDVIFRIRRFGHQKVEF